MKKAMSLTLAAVMAVSSSICAYAEGKDDAALRSALSTVKDRVEIPAELEEFNYSVSTNNLKDVYNFVWTIPATATEYKEISVRICGSVITRYADYSKQLWAEDCSLAKLSADQMYKKAKAAVKMLNPTVADNISIDKDSLAVSLNGNEARFSLVRTRKGIPVKNNSGYVTVDKNTGELISFNINWHTKASFKDADDILTQDKAEKAYQEMIDLMPMYEVYYDAETKGDKVRLVYRQQDYGEINAFTGAKSNFQTDGYFGSGDITMDEETDSAAPEVNGGANKFTPAELEELDKELPYATEAAVTELLKNNEYFSYNSDMKLQSSYLRKDDEQYIYSASFTSEKNYADEPSYEIYDGYYYEDFGGSYFYEELSVSIDAESGEIMVYDYYNSDKNYAESFDSKAMEQRCEDIAEKLAGKKLDEYTKDNYSVNSYTDKYSATVYYGCDTRWNRKVNDILVSGDNVTVCLAADGTLTSYRINYSDVEFVSPEGMLTEDELMEKFWEKNDLDLYYLARVNENKTKTVLVYGTDSSVYHDAFTGEAVRSYYYTFEMPDTSGIASKKLRKMADVLVAHGLLMGSGAINEKGAVSEAVFADIVNNITEIRLYSARNTLTLADGRKFTGAEDISLTKGDAMIMLAAGECGTKVPALGGIFKSPYKDVAEDDVNVGYYAVAHALIGSDSDTLEADKAFTYADMITLVYDYLSA